MTFLDGTTTLAVAGLQSGTASYSISSLSPGSHNLTAFYGGDTNYDTSTSNPVAQVVNKIVTTTSLSSAPNPAVVGQSVTLNATVSPATATGNVTFSDGANTLGTVNIVRGTATFTTSTLSVGNHTLAATYGGDSIDLGSSAPSVTQSVTPNTGACGLSPGSGASFGAGAYSNNVVTVTSPSGSCGSWTASSPVNWVTISSGAGGTGSGTVTYNVQANPNSGLRSATLTIASQSFSITQAGQGCVFGTQPNVSEPVAGGNDSFNVTLSGADCTWSVSSTPNWLVSVSGGGTGSGKVSYFVQSNTSSSASRTGAIILTTSIGTSRATIPITQAGSTCTYSLTPASQSFTAAGGSGGGTISAPDGCTWTVANGGSPFVTIKGGSGSGYGAFSYTVPANSTGSQRTETLAITGQQSFSAPFSVTEAAGQGLSCMASTNGPAPSAALEGRTELLADLFVTCTGLASATTANVALSLNTNVTNALSGTDSVDATLAIGNTSATGHITGYNTIVWPNVTIGPGSATLHISNVRADASLLVANGNLNLQPAAITGQVSVDVGSDAPMAYGAQAAACAATASGAILACASPTLQFQKGQATAVSGGFSLPAVFQESRPGAFVAGGSGATRLRVSVSNVPASVQVYAPVYPNEGPTHAVLYSANASGAGGTAITGVSSQQLTVTGGAATATWVVLTTNPSQLETWTFPLLFINAGQNDISGISIVGTLAPISTVSIASSSAPVPRYHDFSVAPKIVNLRVTSSVGPSVARQSSLSGRLRAELSNGSGTVTSGSNVGVNFSINNDNSDATQNATGVTVKETLPPGLIYVSCNAPNSTSCTASGNQVQVVYGSLPANTTQTAIVTAQVSSTLTNGTVVETDASAASDDPPADLNAATSSSSFIVQNLPSVLPVQPASGALSSQNFTFQFTDPASWQNLSVVNVLINNFLDGRHACYLAYVVSSSSLVLVDDAGDAGGPFAGALTAGAAGSIQNSQCTVSQLTAVGGGNLLTLTMTIAFAPGFGGNKITYVAARDQAGLNSNWQALGVWQAPFTPPGTISVQGLSPASGSGGTANPVTFTATLSDIRGAADFGVVNVLINSAIDGRQACYLAYVASSNTLILVDDAGDAGTNYAGSMVLNGGSASIQNSQCKVNGFGSSAVKSGSQLVLTLNTTFFGAFSGNRVVWVAGRDAAGANNTDWQAMGTWAVQ